MDIDKKMCKEWEHSFQKYKDVEVVNCEFTQFMKEHPEVDAIGSAANSLGIMDGGLDGVYTRYFGSDLQKEVQKVIIHEHMGEQPVGSSFIVDIPGTERKKLIHTPTMRVPMKIIDPYVVFTCTRSALVEAIKAGCEAVMLPAYGHLTGGLEDRIIAYLMQRAYQSVLDRLGDNSENTWDRYMKEIERILREVEL